MKDNNPLVTVVLPTFNRAKFILEAINTALNQSYRNIEVIVVDDGSKDDTEQILKNIIDSRVKYVRHSENKGAAAARNTGIQLASGEFIAFLDSDDIWQRDKLTKQVDKILLSDQSVALIYCGMLKIDESGRVLGEKKPQYRGEIFKHLLYDNCIGSTSVPLLRMDVLKEIGGFDERLKSREDYDLWLRIAKRYKVEYVQESLFLYCIHENRISTNLNARISVNQRILKKYYSDLICNPKALAHHFMLLGYFHERKKHKKLARKYYFRSLRIFFSVKSMIKYIISFI